MSFLYFGPTEQYSGSREPKAAGSVILDSKTIALAVLQHPSDLLV